MSPKPRREPHVMVAALVGENSKLACLPNDTARLGYFYVVLGKAKLQRPSGRFASRGHWREIAGRFARFLPQYLDAGLVEEAPRLCERCAPKWPGLSAGSLVVHDWHLHQSDPGAALRAAEYRKEHAGDDEPGIDWDGISEGLNADQTAIERASNADQTVSVRSSGVHSRAGARGEREQELELERSTSSTRGRNARARPQDDADPAFALRQWLAAHGAPVRDGDGYHTKLVRLVATNSGKTCGDVVEAFEQLARDGARTSKQFVMGAEDVLFPVLRTSVGKVVDDGHVEREIEETRARAKRLSEPDWIGGEGDG